MLRRFREVAGAGDIRHSVLSHGSVQSTTWFPRLRCYLATTARNSRGSLPQSKQACTLALLVGVCVWPSGPGRAAPITGTVSAATESDLTGQGYSSPLVFSGGTLSTTGTSFSTSWGLSLDPSGGTLTAAGGGFAVFYGNAAGNGGLTIGDAVNTGTVEPCRKLQHPRVAGRSGDGVWQRFGERYRAHGGG